MAEKSFIVNTNGKRKRGEETGRMELRKHGTYRQTTVETGDEVKVITVGIRCVDGDLLLFIVWC